MDNPKFAYNIYSRSQHMKLATKSMNSWLSKILDCRNERRNDLRSVWFISDEAYNVSSDLGYSELVGYLF